jgi:hypothetical protein
LRFAAVVAFAAGFHLDRLTEFLAGCCALLGLAWEGEVRDFMHIVAPHKCVAAEWDSASENAQGGYSSTNDNQTFKCGPLVM